MNIKECIENSIQKYSHELTDCSDAIHVFAEPSQKEYKSSKALCDLLEHHGFLVERGLGELETAFRAVYGTGKIRIGYTCEYDALPSLQQDDVPYRQGNGAYGHGCGHNLLGVGSVGAGIALKEAIDKFGIDATVIVYGTPAEETIGAKAIMIRDGYFRDIDVCLAWHPGDHNDCGEVKSKANTSLEFVFRGTSAHACNCPENGRSALDAAELMSVGCNYLREHISRDSYLHYCYVPDPAHMMQPNIVPDYAKVWYMARTYSYEELGPLIERIRNVAHGAALMTGTEVETEQTMLMLDNKLNFTLSRLAYECMNEIGFPRYTDEEKAYARKISEALNLPGVTGNLEEEVKEPDGTIKKDNGSSDIGNVSRIVPAVNINTTCFGRGTPYHAWGIVVQANKPAAHKGMLFASKVLALMGAHLAKDPELMAKVKDEFEIAPLV